LELPDILDQQSLSVTFNLVDGRLSEEDAVEQHQARFLVSDAAPLLGKTIDCKFKVLALIGQGGMGSVYRALHLQLNKEVALKILNPVQVSPEAWGASSVKLRL
jgi:serine/threonine protein kinase